MATNILTALDAGSGIDSRAVIDGLVAAERAGRIEPLRKRDEALAARISALGQVRSALSGIADSLGSRLRNGLLEPQPRVSEPGLSAERIGLGPASGLDTTIAVNRLASGQRLASMPLAGPDAPVGLGRLVIQFGTRAAPGEPDSFAAGPQPPAEIAITAENNSLVGLRDAINASASGIVASIVRSADAATLVLRGPEGEAGGFVISAVPDPGDAGLARFNDTPGDSRMTRSAAADAQLAIDGVAVRRPTNSIDDLVPGLRLRLERPVTAARVTAVRGAGDLPAVMADLASALGALRSLVGELGRGGGPGTPPAALAGDATRRAVDDRLARLIGTAPPGTNGLTLRDLGLSAQRDGSLTFDEGRLSVLPPERLGDARALLRLMSGPGVAGGLRGIADLAGDGSRGLERQRSTLAREQAQAEARLDRYRAGLVRQFAVMDRLVSSARAVEAQLDQQIALLTRRD